MLSKFKFDSFMQMSTFWLTGEGSKSRAGSIITLLEVSDSKDNPNAAISSHEQLLNMTPLVEVEESNQILEV